MSRLAWDTSALLTEGLLSVAAGLPGDYNGDGMVTVADYVVWRDSLGASGPNLAADANGDQVVDSHDYHAWKAGYLAAADSNLNAPHPVPEPRTLLTTCIVISMVLAATRNWQAGGPCRLQKHL